MKILNISLDKKVFENNSKSRLRVEEYSSLFERFDLVVFTGKNHKRVETPTMIAEPTNSRFKFLHVFNACSIGKRMISQNNYDVVSSQDPFESGWVAWRLARRFDIRFQVQIHGDFFGSPYWRRESFLNRLRYHLGKFVVGRADSIRVVSERIKKSLMDMGVSSGKIMVTPIYSPVSGHGEKRAKNNDKFVFLTVGRLVNVKNIGIQIEALNEVLKTHPETELWIVGDGEEKEKLKIKSGDLKVSEKVKFLGWQENTDEFYKQADVFLLTSNYEGWGMAVIEAASFGLPIIMTDVGCAGEVIKDEESGIVIGVEDRDGLVSAMNRVMEDKSFAGKIGEGARRAAASLPDKEKSLDLYRKSFNI